MSADVRSPVDEPLRLRHAGWRVLHTGSGPARLVADRDETKFLILGPTGARVARVLDHHLPPLSPPAGTGITSVYFDTPRREILAAARADGRSVKVRVKEYETRLDPDEVWLELKLREGSRTGKLRLSIGRGRALTAIATPAEHAGPLSGELARLQRTLSGTLVPACTVAYRRQAWQTPDESIRVTIDTDIRFAAPPPGSWAAAPLGLVARTRAAPLEEGILELKLRVAQPPWLAGLVEQLALSRSPFSKFVAGSQALAQGLPQARGA